MGDQYMHNWKPKLRAAVETLEELVVMRFREAAKDERVGDVGSYGQLVDSYKNEQLPKWWITWCRGTESNCRHQPFQGCALPTELPRHFGRMRGGVPVYRITEEKSTLDVRCGGEGGI